MDMNLNASILLPLKSFIRYSLGAEPGLQLSQRESRFHTLLYFMTAMLSLTIGSALLSNSFAGIYQLTQDYLVLLICLTTCLFAYIALAHSIAEFKTGRGNFSQMFFRSLSASAPLHFALPAAVIALFSGKTILIFSVLMALIIILILRRLITEIKTEYAVSSSAAFLLAFAPPIAAMLIPLLIASIYFLI